MRDAPPWSPPPYNQLLEGLEYSQWANFSVLVINQPKSYWQAKVSPPQWSDWKKAMDDGLKSLKENDVGEVIQKPVRRKFVTGRWVFTVKENCQGEVWHYKARLVAKGFWQTLGQDYIAIFAPIVPLHSLGSLLGMSACKQWRPRQPDIKTALFYGILNEEVYIHRPESSLLDAMIIKIQPVHRLIETISEGMVLPVSTIPRTAWICYHWLGSLCSCSRIRGSVFGYICERHDLVWSNWRAKKANYRWVENWVQGWRHGWV